MNENTNSMMPELTLGGEAAQMEMPTLVLGLIAGMTYHTTISQGGFI